MNKPLGISITLFVFLFGLALAKANKPNSERSPSAVNAKPTASSGPLAR